MKYPCDASTFIVCRMRTSALLPTQFRQCWIIIMYVCKLTLGVRTLYKCKFHTLTSYGTNTYFGDYIYSNSVALLGRIKPNIFFTFIVAMNFIRMRIYCFVVSCSLLCYTRHKLYWKNPFPFPLYIMKNLRKIFS